MSWIRCTWFYFWILPLTNFVVVSPSLETGTHSPGQEVANVLGKWKLLLFFFKWKPATDQHSDTDKSLSAYLILSLIYFNLTFAFMPKVIEAVPVLLLFFFFENPLFFFRSSHTYKIPRTSSTYLARSTNHEYLSLSNFYSFLFYFISFSSKVCAQVYVLK